MSDHHGHAHSVADTPLRPLLAALAITFGIFITQMVGALLSGSLALMSDSMHMLSDSTALILAAVAALIGRQVATSRATFGHRRVEVFAAMVNAVAVVGVTSWIAIRAVGRFGASSGADIDSSLMFVVAVIGLLANAASAAILWRYQEDSLNVRAAFLHVLTDLLGSAIVIVAAAVIHLTGWSGADALASLLIAAVVLPRALRLLWDSTEVLLERAPRSVDTDAVSRALLEVDGVGEIHDLHIWSTDGSTPLATCHVVVDRRYGPDAAVLDRVQAALSAHGIHHSTIQIEEPGHHAHEHYCH